MQYLNIFEYLRSFSK